MMIEGLLTNKVGCTINGYIVMELTISMEEMTFMGVDFMGGAVRFRDPRRIMTTILLTRRH